MILRKDRIYSHQFYPPLNLKSMKTLFFSIFILTVFIFISCSTDSIPKQEEIVSQTLPENTPFIMGLLEATYDTVHHHPEIVVGFVNNVEGYINPDRMRNIPRLFNTTLYTQVTKTTRLFHLTFTPDKEALVFVAGPVNHKEEKKVLFEYLGEGLYGDTKYDLNLIPGEEYKLNVEFSDGRSYQKSTKIPGSTSIEVPDSIGIRVDYTPYNDGSAQESSPSDSNYYIKFLYPEGSYYFEAQSNSNRDREQLLLEPEEEFLYSDRSSYLRDGSLYHIAKTTNVIKDSLRRQWGQDLYDKTEEEVWHSKYFWMRFSFINEDLGDIFHPAFDFYSSRENFDEVYNRFIEEFEARNPSYLLDVSTIQKVNEEGEVLPQSETDAVGFFAGYFSVYRTTTLYPLRTFDLDSVLQNNRVYNPDS